ncbi:MAG: hypothetical protein KC423_10905, partial [Anaerolineales bacterium]|nr:hypothetical protein [Anaerolineales bacterium]
MKREQKPVNKPPAAGQHPTQRIRPGTRAVNREAKNVARPMPQPPARRPLGQPAAKAAAARALSDE